MRRNIILRGVLAIGLMCGFPAWCASAMGAGEARALLKGSRLSSALERVQKALASNPSDPELLCLLGDIQYRRAEFDEAGEAYAAAIESSPGLARARWGMGRIHRLRFEQAAALREFSAAYHLDPFDADVILAYADAAPEGETRRRLWRRYLHLVDDKADPERVADIRARLTVEETLGDRALSRLASEYRKYRFPLTRFFAAGAAPNGLLLTVRIADGAPLRLIFDTGGSGVIVNAKAIRGAPLRFLSEASIGGMGSNAPRAARTVLAPSLEVGELRIENLVMQVAGGEIVNGADGVIGADVFRAFLVTVDGRSPALELAPFERPEAAVPGPAPTPVYSVAHFLLVRAAFAGSRKGYYLLDTGAAHSIIAGESTQPVFGSISFRGAQGAVHGVQRIQPVRLKLAGAEWSDLTPVAADMSEFSERQGVEIAGAIGYSLLGRLVLTINYRDGWVRLSGRR